MKEYDNEQEQIVDVPEQVVLEPLQPLDMGELNNLLNEGDYYTLAEKLIKGNANAVIYSETEYAEIGQANADTVQAFLTDLVRVDTEGTEITPDRHASILGLLHALSTLKVDYVEAGYKDREKWLGKLKNGEVSGVELVRDEDKIVEGIAHDFILSNSAPTIYSSQAESIMQNIYFKVSADDRRDQKVKGATFGGESARDLYVKQVQDVTEQYIKEKGIEENYADHRAEIDNRERNDYKTGFYVRFSTSPDPKNLFEKVPEHIAKLNAINSEEEIISYESEIREKIDFYKNYEREVQASIEVAKKLLRELEATEPGHTKSESYKELHFALKNFTKLGNGFYNVDKHVESNEIGVADVNVAIDELRFKAYNYIEAHTGMSNLFNSNVGYGATRLSLARDIYDFSNRTGVNVDKYGQFTGVPKEKIKGQEKLLKYANKKRKLLDAPERPINPEEVDEAEIYITSDLKTAKSLARQHDTYMRENPVHGKSYENYIKLRTGYNAVFGDPAKTQDRLANVIAANLLKASGKEFSTSLIHSTAKSIKSMTEFKTISTDPHKVLCSMLNPEAADRTTKRLISNTYGIAPENIEKYVRRMTKLYNNMKPKGSQSTEYRAFKTAVENIKNLATNFDLTKDEGRQQACEQVVQMNANLIAAVGKYTSGKEAVRTTNEGQYRYENAMDALSILVDEAPKTKDQAMEIVNKTNKVRKVKESSKDYVDLINYGEMRAAQSLKDRQPEQQPAAQPQAPRA